MCKKTSKDRERVAVSRFMISLLRHGVPGHRLALDAFGWASLSDFITVVRNRFPHLSAECVVGLVESCPKRRYRRDGDRISAWYGHSVSINEPDCPVQPPQTLYHGTNKKSWQAIRQSGLRAGKRKYVHLSRTPQEALLVGKRKGGETVVLCVRAADACQTGVLFYDKGTVVVATEIPAEFVTEHRAPDGDLRS